MDSFLQHIDYADDICLLSHSVLDAANMLYSLENKAASSGLQINTAKTKSMSIVNSSTTRQPRPNAIVLNRHPVEEVNVAKYARMVAEAIEILSPIWRNSSYPALKYAYLKTMSYQFCCMVQALGKSPKQSPPNYKSF